MKKEAHLEGHLLISIGMMLTMLHKDRFIVPILKRVGRGKEKEERREVYEGRKWFTRDREGKGGETRRKERGVVYKGGVVKRSGEEEWFSWDREGRGGRKEEWFMRCGGDGWGRGAVYKGQRG